MDRYMVEITEEALSDMEKIYKYIADVLLAPENAMGQYNRIAEAILALESFPERYKLFDIEPEHSWGMRRMAVDNFVVCYLIDAEKVIVTDVLFGASNIHDWLQKRHEM